MQFIHRKVIPSHGKMFFNAIYNFSIYEFTIHATFINRLIYLLMERIPFQLVSILQRIMFMQSAKYNTIKLIQTYEVTKCFLLAPT